MGNITLGRASKQQIKEAAKLSQKSSIPKQNVYKGHIREYINKEQNPIIIEYVPSEEFDLMKKFENNPKEAQVEMDEINKKNKKNIEMESNFNKKDSENFFDKEKSSQMEMISGRRQFTDSTNKFDFETYNNTGFVDSDSDFLKGTLDDKQDFFQQNLAKIQDNFEDKKPSEEKPMVGKYEQPSKKRTSVYPTNNFIDRYLSPERIPGTFTANELHELFETLRYISPHGAEERKLAIEKFSEKTKIKIEDVEKILNLNNSFYTVQFKERKYGFWNLSAKIEPQDIL